MSGRGLEWVSLVCLLGGCATTTSITELGNGKYLARAARGMLFGESSAIPDAVAAAQAYCGESNLTANVIDTDVSTAASDGGASETATVTFVCGDEDSDLEQTSVVRPAQTASRPPTGVTFERGRLYGDTSFVGGRLQLKAKPTEYPDHVRLTVHLRGVAADCRQLSVATDEDTYDLREVTVRPSPTPGMTELSGIAPREMLRDLGESERTPSILACDESFVLPSAALELVYAYAKEFEQRLPPDAKRAE